MHAVNGTPVTIDGHTAGSPGPATTTVRRIPIPVPPGRTFGGNGIGGVQQQATTFARSLRVRNLDGSIDLKVSFIGDSYVTVKAGTSEEFVGNFSFFSVQSASSTVQWEAVAVVAS